MYSTKSKPPIGLACHVDVHLEYWCVQMGFKKKYLSLISKGGVNRKQGTRELTGAKVASYSSRLTGYERVGLGCSSKISFSTKQPNLLGRV